MCETEGCEMNGVPIAGLDSIPADLLPVTCGACGAALPSTVPDPVAPPVG